MRFLDKLARGLRAAKTWLLPLTHLLGFVLILLVLTAMKRWTIPDSWKVPPLAAWEFAALVHVFLVAQKMMDFRGFEYASKRFNSWIRRGVLNVIGLFILLKLATFFFETKTTDEKGILSPLVTLGSSAGGTVNQAIELVSPYILVMPLFFFFLVNVYARHHVIMRARQLRMLHTDQELYLTGLIKFVDLPVILPFSLMVGYLKLDPVCGPDSEGLVVGIIGCCLLIVSNLLTGVFDEHWVSAAGRDR